MVCNKSNYICNMTEIENKFNLACELQSKGQQEESYRLLYEGYLAYCNNP